MCRSFSYKFHAKQCCPIKRLLLTFASARGCSGFIGLGKSESSFQPHNLEAEDKNFVFEIISIMIPYLLDHH
jgi:hypothetical protein